MSEGETRYLLSDSSPELERLRLQARVWMPEAEAVLDRIPVKAGGKCVDPGCGGTGILGPLSKRVVPEGRGVGIERDPVQLSAAREFVASQNLQNVDILEQDACRTDLPREGFDLVNIRFLFAPVGRDPELLREMIPLARPGGAVANQEPISSTWGGYPTRAGWNHLQRAILEEFRAGGGDFDAGERTFSMLKSAGIQDLRLRAAVIPRGVEHPYRRLPVQFATSVRTRMLEHGLWTEAELAEDLAECEKSVLDPSVLFLTFVGYPDLGDEAVEDRAFPRSLSRPQDCGEGLGRCRVVRSGPRGSVSSSRSNGRRTRSERWILAVGARQPPGGVPGCASRRPSPPRHGPQYRKV